MIAALLFQAIAAGADLPIPPGAQNVGGLTQWAEDGWAGTLERRPSAMTDERALAWARQGIPAEAVAAEPRRTPGRIQITWTSPAEADVSIGLEVLVLIRPTETIRLELASYSLAGSVKLREFLEKLPRQSPSTALASADQSRRMSISAPTLTH
ncbi:MAG: hypothetical protein MH204_04385 [Fimbriimonadaceae bacterium]|nr:hypothetical protein [Fimbriimonadaceae bacterium]